MGKGTIVRVLEGTELTPQILSRLSELLPNFKLTSYAMMPDYSSSITHRIDSLLGAFFFLLKAYPLNPAFTVLTIPTLINHALECRKACNLKHISLDELHKELVQFTAQLVGVILVSWDWQGHDPVEEAIECLNDAECYKMMLESSCPDITTLGSFEIAGKKDLRLQLNETIPAHYKQLVNDAEYCEMMFEGGRPKIATLSSFEIAGKKDFSIQLDEPIPAHYEQLITELRKIKALNYPKTPVWFRELRESQQAYFHNLDSQSSTSIKSAMLKDFNQFQAEWDAIKLTSASEMLKDLNQFETEWNAIKLTSLNLQTDLQQISTNSAPFPLWFKELSPNNKEMIRILSRDPARIDAHLKEFQELLSSKTIHSVPSEQFKILKILPEWYWFLPELHQYFLEYVLSNTECIEDAVSSVSSRLRTLPLPSNYGAHTLYTIRSDGSIIRHFDKRYRSSHIVSRDVLHAPESVQIRHSDSNFETIMAKALPNTLILMQTHISPLPLPNLPDKKLYASARATVARSKWAEDTYEHNHPFNLAKLVYYTQAHDADSTRLLAKARPYTKHTPGLSDLLNEYERVLHSGRGTATYKDYIGRELYLSSLEQLIILTLEGFPYSSCVSGKDRKAIELLHTDALIKFKEIFGRWPKFNELTTKEEQEDRAHFVAIFTHFYCSGHQQTLAELNAYGSKGIKTPDRYLPADIIESINKQLGSPKAVDHEDRLASDNEVKNISSSLRAKIPEPNQLLGTLLAKELGEATCTKLYNALSQLICEVKLFEQNATWGLHWKPMRTASRGITSIRTLMENSKSGESNIMRIGSIFSIILGRPTSGNRARATDLVYTHIRNLLKPNDPTPLVVRVHKAEQAWLELFEESKRENSLSPHKTCSKP